MDVRILGFNSFAAPSGEELGVKKQKPKDGGEDTIKGMISGIIGMSCTGILGK